MWFELGVALCGILWSTSYVLMIARARRDRLPAMPLVPLALNISWEFIFGFVLLDVPPMFWVDRVWFAIDCVLLYQMLRYGHRENAPSLPMWQYRVAVFGLVALSFASILMFSLDVRDLHGDITGWGSQVVLSIGYLTLLERRGSSQGQSLPIALTRALGTLCLVPCQMSVSNGRFFTVVYVAVFVVDSLYIVRLWKVLATERRSQQSIESAPAFGGLVPQDSLTGG